MRLTRRLNESLQTTSCHIIGLQYFPVTNFTRKPSFQGK